MYDFSIIKHDQNNLNQHKYSESFRKIVASAINKIKREQELRKAIFRKQIVTYRASHNKVKDTKQSRYMIIQKIEKLRHFQYQQKHQQDDQKERIALPIIIQSKRRIKSLSKSEDFQCESNIRSHQKAYRNRSSNLNLSIDCKSKIQKFPVKSKHFKIEKDSQNYKKVRYVSKSQRKQDSILQFENQGKKFKKSTQFYQQSRYAEFSSKLVPWDFQKPEEDQRLLY